jgi:hypothetical protein
MTKFNYRKIKKYEIKIYGIISETDKFDHWKKSYNKRNKYCKLNLRLNLISTELNKWFKYNIENNFIKVEI